MEFYQPLHDPPTGTKLHSNPSFSIPVNDPLHYYCNSTYHCQQLHCLPHLIPDPPHPHSWKWSVGHYHQFKWQQGFLHTISKIWIPSMTIATELQQMEASMFLAQETNTAWTPLNVQTIKTQCQQVYQHIKMATSASQEPTNNWCQLDGTLTISLNKWANEVINWGQDALLGIWFFIELLARMDKESLWCQHIMWVLKASTPPPTQLLPNKHAFSSNKAYQISTHKSNSSMT